MLFVEEFQFPQVMFIAESVETLVVGKVRLEMIVDDPVFTARNDVEVIHRFDASFGVDAIEGHLGVAQDVQPVKTFIDPQPAFIAVIDWSQRQQVH